MQLLPKTPAVRSLKRIFTITLTSLQWTEMIDGDEENDLASVLSLGIAKASAHASTDPAKVAQSGTASITIDGHLIDGQRSEQ